MGISKLGKFGSNVGVRDDPVNASSAFPDTNLSGAIGNARHLRLIGLDVFLYLR
jgi:hypothetical protein